MSGGGLTTLLLILSLAFGLPLLSGCETPGGGGGNCDGYELVYEDPEHHQVWWPEVDADGGMLVCERQINTYPLTDGGRVLELTPEPTHYCLCVIMTLDLATGETRQLTNGSSRYNDWMPSFSADGDWIHFLRRDELQDPVVWHLCRVPVDGSESRVEYITDGDPPIWWYETFADGDRALVSYVEGGEYRTGIIDLATGVISELEHARGYKSKHLNLTTDEEHYYSLTYTGDSPSGYRIFRHPVGAGVAELFEAPGEYDGFIRLFNLSPDGTELLANIGYCFDNRTYLQELPEGSPAPIIDDEPYVSEIRWAADGYVYFCKEGYLRRYRP